MKNLSINPWACSLFGFVAGRLVVGVVAEADLVQPGFVAEVVRVDATCLEGLLQAYGIVEIGKRPDLDRVAHLLQGERVLLVGGLLVEQRGNRIFHGGVVLELASRAVGGSALSWIAGALQPASTNTIRSRLAGASKEIFAQGIVCQHDRCCRPLITIFRGPRLTQPGEKIRLFLLMQAIKVQAYPAALLSFGEILPRSELADLFRSRNVRDKQFIEEIGAKVRGTEAGQDLAAGFDQVRQAAHQPGPMVPRR